MELLYVVELEVRPAKTSSVSRVAEVYDRVLSHLVDWLNHEHEDALSVDALAAPNALTLHAVRDDRSDQRVAWTVEGAGEVGALLLAVRTEIRASGRADFICAITVYRDASRVALRIELGRESLDGVLAPAGLDVFRRPYLLLSLLRDRELECRAGTSLVDGRFNWINPGHCEVLWEAMTREGRVLPMLLVDGSKEGGELLAKRCAAELAALAPVVAVDARSLRLLGERLASIDAEVPPGGARLVWPDLSLRHPSFTRDQVAFAPGRLLRLLSSISVTVRGVNGLRQAAAAAQRAARSEQMARELADARAQGDQSLAIAKQTEIIDDLRDHEVQWTSWIETLERERDDYKAQAAQAAYWKQEAERARQASGVRTTDWNEAPELDPVDLTDLARYLEAQAQSAIVFTPAAHRGWKKDDYLHVEVMRKALITLAQTAMEYRRLRAQLGLTPDDWFKQEWDLNLASTDQYMAKNKMDDFEFEGHTYCRQPHLKLGDHTAPNEVGRVYFAMDSDAERFIVDHVGLKLYGL